MTKEDKDLLLRDLCARLPYGVKVYYKTAGWEDKNHTLSPQVIDNFLIRRVVVKPYLRPLSSMTEEEGVEYCDFQDKFLLSSQYPVTDWYALFDWLNAHHFDYRGLIEKGLAIEVTKDNNPYKD